MKKTTNSLRVLLVCILAAYNIQTQAQHTFSIVAVDPVTGEMGSAGATCLDIDDLSGEEGAVVINDIILGIGVINTQAAWSPVNQAAARDRMEAGDSPQAILNWLFANDPASGSNQSRQYGIVDLIGGSGGTPRSAGFTGTQNGAVANHIVGPNYAIQGNILISQDVLDDMETGFLNANGTLADKLMAALQGAKRIGAQSNCASNQTSSKSAFLRVAKVDDLYSNYGHVTVDLNVSKTNFAEDPIDVLQTTYDFYLANPGFTCSNTISTFPYEESFENGLGLWQQNDLDLSHIGNTDFDWTRRSGSTPTTSSGPQTANDGNFYLYTEASGTNVGFPTKRAVLNSPCMDFSGLSTAFLTFDYHMFGANTGNLTVRVNDGNGWKTIWLLEGNQGNNWNSTTLDLSTYVGNTIQIRMDSTTGLGPRSDVAIDNLRITTTTGDEPPATYCDANGQNPTEEYISRVQLGTIDNISAASVGGYGDFTSSSTTLNTTNTITITPTWSGTVYNEGYAVWIDYNKDGDFTDTNELVWSKAPSRDAVNTGSFTIPSGTSSGTTRMRVAMKYNAIPNSCESFRFGEVEDYTVIIDANRRATPFINSDNVKRSDKDIFIYPNPATSLLHITLNDPNDSAYKIYNIAGQVVQKGTFTETIDVASLHRGVYILQINTSEEQYFKRIILQ
ncbi:hypothetical protein GCM10009430_24500 [Aquimarina litoralis]|uniref:MAM domain-containing protein n=1 Tax=Aquimarina litoralis TaxID=584605 RepID=A0ABN1IVL2_9FLAO